MKKNLPAVIIVIFFVFVGILLWLYARQPVQNTNAGIATSTAPIFDQGISDGVISVPFSSKDFGLAVNKSQILVSSYIPPCDEVFNYCLYYIGSEYHGTNFESAGIRLQKRVDLANERLCLDTPPVGFSKETEPTATHADNTYSSSFFSVGSGAAGHYAEGYLYRLFVRENNGCYELETRIGQTQFANYPSGTIREFTSPDKAKLESEIRQIVSRITLTTGEKDLFTY